MDAKDREKLLADKPANDTEFRKFWEDMKARFDTIQASLDDEMKRAKALDSELVKLLVFEKSLKQKLQSRSDNRQKVENLKYRLDDAVAKECRSETIITFS